MHLALSTMHLTLQSGNIKALLEAISSISSSPILATVFGSNPEKASLCKQETVKSCTIRLYIQSCMYYSLVTLSE
ncbi:hypothetical protein RchiOBHm_Chr4g0437201 [Rosa chinensis]|uniref:Uncharacterized protein n=1 Tax=Rosa chinensis TaxID=74649 RepID=A0A2P6R292_ROSCH|nr:hypothetical protein RchiOBHm_Chr4g0437201 [Rosa chinensis]